MAIKLGMNCALYYGTAGAQADTLADNVRDLTINLETGEADVTTRGNSGWRATQATLKDGTLEFEAIWDTDEAFFTALQEAYFDGTSIALLALTDSIGSGGDGLDADFTITNLTRNESLEEAVTASVTAKIAYSSTHAPSWYTES